MQEVHYSNLGPLFIWGLIAAVVSSILFYIIIKKGLAPGSTLRKRMVTSSLHRIKGLLAQSSGLGHKIGVGIRAEDVGQSLSRTMISVITGYYIIYMLICTLVTIILVYFVPYEYEVYVVALGCIIFVFLLELLLLRRELFKEAIQTLNQHIADAKGEHNTLQEIVVELIASNESK